MREKEEKLAQLNHIYQGATADEAAVAFLHDALYDSDYLVRSKAFLLTERRHAKAMRTEFYDILVYGEREWQLRAMNVLKMTADEAILPYLRPCLFQRRQPLLIRAAFITLAAVGSEKSLMLIAEFLKSPYCAYLKDAFLGDVLADALQRTKNAAAMWAKITASDQNLRVFSNSLLPHAEKNPLLTVYPYPDYLAEMAKERGISAEEWKKAMYFPRKKNTSKNNQK